MKLSDYKYFYKENFLDDDLHKQMLDPINQCVGLDLYIDDKGNIYKYKSNVVENRYYDNTVLKKNLPNPTSKLIQIIENELKFQGLKLPVVYNLSTLTNPTVDPFYNKSSGWHKDYNVIKHIHDPHKLWFTMLSLSKEEVNSEFMISITPEGPEFYNYGIRTTVNSNKLFGHNINFGHQYTPKDKNQVGFLYIRWFDAN